MRSIMILAICISLLSLSKAQGQEVATPSDSPAALAANGTRLIATRKPDGLIISQGNLYFTSHDAVGATVWRTSQTAVPGQERVLFWEPGAIFSDITFAKINGAFFGYFFAKRVNQNFVTIRRVSLSGGAATVLATIPTFDLAKTHRNLVTDGVGLFWQDKDSVRRIPIGGGASTVLDRTTPTDKPTAGLVFQGNRIFYAAANKIIFVPTVGSIVSPLVRTLVTTTGRVTALHVLSSTLIYWGEENGAVRRKSGSAIATLGSKPGFVPTSITGFPESPEAWTQCSSQSCELRVLGFVVNSTMTVDPDALGVSVNSSTSPFFWGDAAGVHRPGTASIAAESSKLP